MAITGTITRQVPVPHEDGQTFTFRLLGWKQIEQAKQARTSTQFENLRAMGVDLLQAFQGLNRGEVAGAAAGAAAGADPFDIYDKATLLRLGITAWSYDTPVSEEAIDALDAVTATWAARQVLELSGLTTVDPTPSS